MPRGSKLSRANAFIAAHTKQGTTFVPLGKDCLLLRCARKFGIPTVTVALAASYYQRLVDAPRSQGRPRKWVKMLEDALLPYGLLRFSRPRTGHSKQPITFQASVRGEDDVWPVMIYTMCLHIAIKVSMARETHIRFNAMLAHTCRTRVTADDLRRMERWILQQLRYEVTPVSRQPEPYTPRPPCMSPVQPKQPVCGGHSRSPCSVLCVETPFLSP